MRTISDNLQSLQARLKEEGLGFTQTHLAISMHPKGFILSKQARTLTSGPCTLSVTTLSDWKRDFLSLWLEFQVIILLFPTPRLRVKPSDQTSKLCFWYVKGNFWKTLYFSTNPGLQMEFLSMDSKESNLKLKAGPCFTHSEPFLVGTRVCPWLVCLPVTSKYRNWVFRNFCRNSTEKCYACWI